MRPNKLWTTIKQIQFERSLMMIPRRDRRALRAYVAGKHTK